MTRNSSHHIELVLVCWSSAVTILLKNVEIFSILLWTRSQYASNSFAGGLGLPEVSMQHTILSMIPVNVDSDDTDGNLKACFNEKRQFSHSEFMLINHVCQNYHGKGFLSHCACQPKQFYVPVQSHQL